MHRYDPERDAYITLGVDPKATQEEVEAAFRRSALVWHPDKSPAPDAAERFLEVQKAGEILRDPESRRDYDIVRERHMGRTFRPRASSPTEPPTSTKPPEPHVPMRSPPAWLAAKVRVHMDSVMLTLQTPPPSPVATRLCNALACVALGGGLAIGSLELGALALVLWSIGRLVYVPPYGGTLAWAKIVPGRQIAEFHSLDQRHQRYRRHDVPYHHLRVALVESADDFRIEIHGFPRAVAPVLLRTRDLDEAKRCAREAGRWLSLPLARAA
jgi:hypothetical protein